MSKFLRAALAYQKMGYELVPLHSIRNGICTCKKGKDCPCPGKHPRTQKGLLEASRDSTIINSWFKKWPDSNIALLTGRTNGFIVIDVDINKNLGKFGNESLEHLEEKLGKLPDTVEQITGSGGRHLLFKAPSDAVANRTGIEPWIDVKAENGYIVVSPSIHISGNSYVWELSSRIDEMEMAELPSSWLNFISDNKKSKGKNLKKEPLIIGEKLPNGSRNTGMFKIACSLQAKGYNRDEIKALLDVTNKQRCDPPLSDSELDTIIDSTVDRYQQGDSVCKITELDELVFDEIYCIFNKNAGTYRPKNVQENVERLLNHYSIIPKYNELTKALDVEIPGRKFTKDNSEELTLQYIYNLCLKHGFVNLSKDLIKAIILDVGDRDKYNPVKIYINKCVEDYSDEIKKDGYKELEKLYSSIETNSFDPAIKEMLIKKWLISCVEAIYCENGIAAQGILILQGEQGEGKTTWFKRLFSFNPDWFAEGLTLDPANKDSVSKAVSYWVCELGEIEATLKKDLDMLKSYVTNTCDVLRRPYARGTSHFPRRTIFCGSVNGSEFLKDDTGNRRFWTISVSKIHLNLDINYGKLWAEVFSMKQNGENWYLLQNEIQILQVSNKVFEAKNYIDTLIEANFYWDSKDRFWLKASDIFTVLGAVKELSSTKIGIALKKKNTDSKLLDGYRYYKIPKAKNVNSWNYEKIPNWAEEIDSTLT